MDSVQSISAMAMIPPPQMEHETEELRAERVRTGLCPQCGTQLYETVRMGVLRKKVTRPLSIAGQVVRGQCVRCINGGDSQGDAAAIALASIVEPTTANDFLPAANPSGTDATANPVLSISAQMDATYTGGFNNYGERHGEGLLTWSNGDRYKGTLNICYYNVANRSFRCQILISYPNFTL
jgi:hypothetical protein